MRIKTILYLALSTSFLIILILGATTYTLHKQLEESKTNQRLAEKIQAHVTSLLVLTYESTWQSEERPIKQWGMHYREIMTTLDKVLASRNTTEISMMTKRLGVFFERFIDRRDTPTDEFQLRRNTLIGVQLINQTQSLSDAVQEWKDNEFRLFQKIEKRLITIIAIAVLSTIGILVCLSILLIHRVLIPLQRLHEAVLAVAKGDTTIRSDTGKRDELGEVAKTFDAMALDLVSQLRDEVQKQKFAKARLELAANVFTYAYEGISITDEKGNIIEVNSAFTRITGYSQTEVLGKNSTMFNSGIQDKAFYQAMQSYLSLNDYWSGELWNRHKDGGLYAISLIISAVKDDSGKVVHYVCLFSDITKRKEEEQQLKQIAHFDHLTKLPNRALLNDRLQQAIAMTTRRKSSLAIAFIDLDGFKAVNDEYGHACGDQLLVSIAHRFQETLREGDTLARLGGDEFIALLCDIDKSSCEMVLQRLVEAAQSPVTIGNTHLSISASIGVTIFPNDHENAETLIRHADQAMYSAKQTGKNQFVFFQSAAINE
jgi:diguanylate cyclase (GGDEF)-like protein/PAS domain S-box-containing protein